MRSRAVVMTMMLAVTLGGRARADGAFPDSSQILLPSDHDQQIILGTTFGLVVSQDDGKSWRWICEEAIGVGSYLYQLGPAPADALYAVGPAGLVYSDDGGCSWQRAQGAIAGQSAKDAFVDPNDPTRVMALATMPADGGAQPMGLFASSDGGKTFAAPSYATPSSASLDGVEIARSLPQTMVLTMLADWVTTPRPYVLRSSDGGATFQSFEQTAVVGNSELRIAAIDPIDAATIYFRAIPQEYGLGDSLAISVDGGATLRNALMLTHSMSAFLRRSDGALLVGTREGDGFISVDGGQTFSPWAHAPHLRGLAERNGKLYAAANDSVDFAVGASSDGGASWTGLLQFNQIQGPMQCGNLPSVCAGPWQTLQATLNPMSPPQTAPPDLGTSVPSPPPQSSGCAVGGVAAPALPWLTVAAIVMLALRRRRAARL